MHFLQSLKETEFQCYKRIRSISHSKQFLKADQQNAKRVSLCPFIFIPVSILRLGLKFVKLPNITARWNYTPQRLKYLEKCMLNLKWHKGENKQHFSKFRLKIICKHFKIL